jgi:exodeoxyribonuclease V alpha subunit
VPDPDLLASRSLEVEVVAVRFRLPDGDFAVLGAVTDEGDEVTVTGPLAHVHPGEALEVGGTWREHPRHGWQFHADRVTLRAPVSGQAILAYLGSVKHVGKRGAAWLFDRHGPEVLAAIDEDPERRLGEVPGIGRAKLGAAVRSWEAQAELRAVRLFLEEHGVPAAAAARIYRHFGASSVDLLREDPYALTELDGIGWATADALARALGTPADAPGRLDAGIVHALELAESDGHCFLPRGELSARAQELLGADVAPRLDALALGGRIVVEADRVWEARMHQTERTLARRVRELLDAEPALGIEDPERPSEGAFVPSDAQWAVVERVLGGRLTILTGGPGTGKTQTMRALVDLLAAERRRVRLCAPTGKAARRLAETTGGEATTIHRLLEWVPGEGFARDEGHPIEGADLLVVDEASMLDVRLAAALLDAVGPRTHVLLVGDPDQLSPVGAGRVLEDLLDAGTVPTVRLTEVFRQAARSMIVRAAHAVNAGRHPPVAPDAGDVHDFFLIGRTDPGAIFAEVCELAAERLPRHYGIHPAEVQVLAPMHKGPLGIDAFNEALRARLNPDGKAVPGTGLRLGDRVMQVVNNHERELMNGELGVLVSHDAERDQVIFAGDDGRRVRLDTRETETLRLAHAISVHKAQGSQMPVVVLPLHRAHRIMLTRNLLYTGLTRAQRAAVLVGEPEAIGHALGRTDARRRHTALEELVR